jgi:HEAT repeat protein
VLHYGIGLAIMAASIPARGDERVEALSGTDGRIEVRQGTSTIASFTPHTPPGRRGAPSAKIVVIANRRVLEARIPVGAAAQPGAPAVSDQHEVWIAEIKPRGAVPIVSGVFGAQDLDGESGRDVVVTDLGIERFETLARLSRCDGKPVRLFQETWDFAAQRFQPIPPVLPPPAKQTIEARRGDPAMSTHSPLGGFFWTSASTGPEATTARALVAPAALNDRNPETAWSTGKAQQGRGQFLTARTVTSGVAITGLRVLPGDTSTQKRFAASGRPERLTLLFGPRDDQRLDVTLREDADGGLTRFREPFWIALPRPVPSACVTLVMREATPGKGGSAAATSLGDVDVMTDLDGPGGTARLIAELLAGATCQTHVPLLVGVGTPALEPVAQAVRDARGPGRACLVEALVGLVERAPDGVAAPGIGAALTSALVGASHSEEKLLFKTLPLLSEAPVAAIAGLLGNSALKEGDRVRAAQALGVIDHEVARRALLGAVGAGPTPVRIAVRSQLAAVLQPLTHAVRQASTETRDTDSTRQADLLFVLGALPHAGAEDLHASVQHATQAYQSSRRFEVRVRAIGALGRLASESARRELVGISQNDPNPVLRYHAVSALGALPHADARGALRTALDDRDPRVRETAAFGLGQKRDAASVPLLIRAAKREPWPFVRRAEIVALGQLCGRPAADLMLRAVSRDVAQIRQAALAGLVRCRDPRATKTLLTTLGRRSESSALRAQAAELLGESCAGAARDTVRTTTRDSDTRVQAAAVATARRCGWL